MNSSSLASIGNLRISERYRLRPPSGDITASALVAAMDYPLTLFLSDARTGAPSTRTSPTAPLYRSDRHEVAQTVGLEEATGQMGGRPGKSD
jgi:hypothetical protein